jgi:hypothetical protein
VEHVGVTTVFPLLETTAGRGGCTHTAEAVGHGAETHISKEDHSFAGAHEILIYYRTQRLITVYTAAHCWSLTLSKKSGPNYYFLLL